MHQQGQLEALSFKLAQFAQKRDWEQFHTPKNLAMALAIEASEIMEIFQWLTAAQSQQLDEAKRQDLADELGDTLIYLVRLADMAGIDLLQAAEDKLSRNEEKYPADQVRGSARKYSEY
jgi:NTP pyrophosphatase (non-canonical NTP hydrolase)